MKQIILALGLGIAITNPVAAETLRVEGRISVNSTTNGFVVHGGGGRGARGMWCAAATFASQVLGKRDTQRIYVAEGSTLNIANFTTNPANLTPSRVRFLSRSISTPGANLSVAHAIGFCSDFRNNNGR